MEQRAEFEGSGNVVVQSVGENNQVTVAGAAALSLTMFSRPMGESTASPPMAVPGKPR
jgi:hypothetical protein